MTTQTVSTFPRPLIYCANSRVQQAQRDHAGRDRPAEHKDRGGTQVISGNARQPCFASVILVQQKLLSVSLFALWRYYLSFPEVPSHPQVQAAFAIL